MTGTVKAEQAAGLTGDLLLHKNIPWSKTALICIIHKKKQEAKKLALVSFLTPQQNQGKGSTPEKLIIPSERHMTAHNVTCFIEAKSERKLNFNRSPKRIHSVQRIFCNQWRSRYQRTWRTWRTTSTTLITSAWFLTGDKPCHEHQPIPRVVEQNRLHCTHQKSSLATYKNPNMQS